MTHWNSASTTRILITEIIDGCVRLSGGMEWLVRAVPWFATIALAATTLTGCSSTLPDERVANSTGRVTASYQAQSKSGKSVAVQVQGEILPLGVAQFLGIPFAEPPVGDRRFRYASPKRFATAQTIEATRFPAACPQNQGNASWYREVAENFGASRELIADQTNLSEDCLYLNVWTPQDSKAPAPVMVWLHGGSNVNGWSYEPNYHGQELATHGVVVVSVQSRLGPLGFLPLVFESSSGSNFALSDQVEALSWVQNNIAQFGGDPSNVTVFGESAGGGNIAALMSGDAAQGLFHKAIIQSGGSGTQAAVSPQAAGKQAAAMFDNLSIDSAQQARERPWQDYVDFAASDSDYYHYPIDDGYYAKRSKDKTNKRASKSIDLLIGTNRHEMLMYLDDTSVDPLGDAVAETGAGGALVATVREYAKAQNWSALEAADFLTGLYYFHCPALQLAQQQVNHGQDVYLYTFTRERAKDKGIKVYHGAEIPYVFDTHDDWLPTNDTDRALTRAMTTYWTNFAKRGSPQSSKLPPWPAYTFERPYTQELGDRVGEYTNLFLNACQLLTHEP